MRTRLLAALTLLTCNFAFAAPLWLQLQLPILYTAKTLEEYDSAQFFDPPPPSQIQALVYNYHLYFSRVEWQKANVFRKEMDAELASSDKWKLVVPYFSAHFTKKDDMVAFMDPYMHTETAQRIKEDVKEIKDYFKRK